MSQYTCTYRVATHGSFKNSLTEIPEINHLTLNVLLHTQTYIYVKIAKRTVMALLQQPTVERMVYTFLRYQHCFPGSLCIMNSSSRHRGITRVT